MHQSIQRHQQKKIAGNKCVWHTSQSVCFNNHASTFLNTQIEMKNANHISKPDQFQVNIVMNWHTLLHIYKTLFVKYRINALNSPPIQATQGNLHFFSLREIINSKIKSSGTLGQGAQKNKGRFFCFFYTHTKRKKQFHTIHLMKHIVLINQLHGIKNTNIKLISPNTVSN